MPDHFNEVANRVDPALEKYLAEGWQSLSAEEVILVSVWVLDGEVNNGGFDQYYWNSGGDLATEVIDALIAINAEHTANIVKQGNALFEHQQPPKDGSVRQKIVDAFQHEQLQILHKMDNEYYQEQDNLIELLYVYCVQKNLLGDEQ